MGFDEEQLTRTQKIGEVWKKLLYKDLEFDKQPKVEVLKLGLEKYKPDVSWTDVLEMANSNISNYLFLIFFY